MGARWAPATRDGGGGGERAGARARRRVRKPAAAKSVDRLRRHGRRHSVLDRPLPAREQWEGCRARRRRRQRCRGSGLLSQRAPVRRRRSMRIRTTASPRGSLGPRPDRAGRWRRGQGRPQRRTPGVDGLRVPELEHRDRLRPAAAPAPSGFRRRRRASSTSAAFCCVTWSICATAWLTCSMPALCSLAGGGDLADDVGHALARWRRSRPSSRRPADQLARRPRPSRPSRRSGP